MLFRLSSDQFRAAVNARVTFTLQQISSTANQEVINTRDYDQYSQVLV